MEISEYVVVVYNFQTGLANRSILVRTYCFIALLISWPWEGAIQHYVFIIHDFITLESISTATMITEYCRIAYAFHMFIWTKFMTPYQNFVLPLTRGNQPHIWNNDSDWIKVKTSFGNDPLSKNEMEALTTNHVKAYVLTNRWSYKFCWETTNWYIW